MTIVHGLLISVTAMAATFVVLAVAGLVVVANRIQDERRGSGCRSEGCRRSRSGQGCNAPRVAETARGIFTEGERNGAED